MTRRETLDGARRRSGADLLRRAAASTAVGAIGLSIVLWPDGPAPIDRAARSAEPLAMAPDAQNADTGVGNHTSPGRSAGMLGARRTDAPGPEHSAADRVDGRAAARRHTPDTPIDLVDDPPADDLVRAFRRAPSTRRYDGPSDAGAGDSPGHEVSDPPPGGSDKPTLPPEDDDGAGDDPPDNDASDDPPDDGAGAGGGGSDDGDMPTGAGGAITDLVSDVLEEVGGQVGIEEATDPVTDLLDEVGGAIDDIVGGLTGLLGRR